MGSTEKTLFNDAPPEMINDAFRLFLKYRGKQHLIIEKEMHGLGWTEFRRRVFYNYNTRKGTQRRGWIDRYGWDRALTIKIEVDTFLATSLPDYMFFEVEQVRRALFAHIREKGVTDANVLGQHERYVQRTIEIYDRQNRENERYKNPMYFMRRLIKDAPGISKELTKALVNAEEELLKWAAGEAIPE